MLAHSLTQDTAGLADSVECVDPYPDTENLNT